jgi:hypothetical protein
MGGIIIEGSCDGTCGGRRGLWRQSTVLIERFIKREKLTAQTVRVHLGKELVRWPRPHPFPGIPAPHLHHRSKIYQLTDTQWQKFSAQVIADLKVQLGKVKKVDLERLTVLSDVVNIAKRGR